VKRAPKRYARPALVFPPNPSNAFSMSELYRDRKMVRALLGQTRVTQHEPGARVA